MTKDKRRLPNSFFLTSVSQGSPMRGAFYTNRMVCRRFAARIKSESEPRLLCSINSKGYEQESTGNPLGEEQHRRVKR
jgi:hypothetical protein